MCNPSHTSNLIPGTNFHQQTRRLYLDGASTQDCDPEVQHLLRLTCETCSGRIQYSIPLPSALIQQTGDPPYRSLLNGGCLDRNQKWTESKVATDVNVREGIRAMLKKDRCLEERRRLGWRRIAYAVGSDVRWQLLSLRRGFPKVSC